MNSHDRDALRGMADHLADVGEVHRAAAKSAEDPQRADCFRREGERLDSIGRALAERADPARGRDEDIGSPFQLLDKLRLTIDDWFDEDDDAEKSAVRDGKSRLAAMIESYLRSPELSEEVRGLLRETKACVGSEPTSDAGTRNPRELARD